MLPFAAALPIDTLTGRLATMAFAVVLMAAVLWVALRYWVRAQPLPSAKIVGAYVVLTVAFNLLEELWG
jgi:hypothetical protein